MNKTYVVKKVVGHFPNENESQLDVVKTPFRGVWEVRNFKTAKAYLAFFHNRRLVDVVEGITRSCHFDRWLKEARKNKWVTSSFFLYKKNRRTLLIEDYRGIVRAAHRYGHLLTGYYYLPKHGY